LEELQLAVQYHGATGPALLVDAKDVVAQGVQALLAEILQELGLTTSDVTSVLDKAGEQVAARWLSEFREQVSQKGRTG
jgi:hypothetical protein